MRQLFGSIAIVIGMIGLAMTADAQPSDWAVPTPVTDDGGTLFDVKFDYLGQTVNLYEGDIEIDSIDISGMPVEQVIEAVKLEFNATIRQRYGIKRDPLNHPVDGVFFKALLEGLCWSKETSQFVDKPPD